MLVILIFVKNISDMCATCM